MPTIQLFEDTHCALLHPFHLVDGVASIRFGAFTQSERWAMLEASAPPNDRPNKGPLKVNARWVPNGAASRLLASLNPGESLVQSGTVLARLGDGTAGEVAVAPSDEQQLIGHANMLFAGLEGAIASDVQAAIESWKLGDFAPGPHTAIFGPQDRVYIAPDATIRAASMDTEAGPILIGAGVSVEPGAHLKGPLILCAGVTVRMGARLSGPSVIGPHSKVGGELSNVNFQGWSNKAHDGFLGNSVIGRWCNLGAGTESSNLKNTYGEVRQWDARTGALIGSGLQFCGLLMGDHSKCGIGTTFNTGTVVDPACVIFDAGFPPKHLPAFSWYNARTGAMEVQSLERMLETAEKVMARRDTSLNASQRANLTRLHAERTTAG